VPFLALCYSLSGGLARDLIRVTRELLEAADRPDQDRGLVPLAERLVQQEIRAKLRAVKETVRQIPSGTDDADFLTELTVLGQVRPGAEDVLTKAAELVERAQEAPPPPEPAPEEASADDSEDVDRPPRTDLPRLQMELGIYLCYCGTVLQVFDAAMQKGSADMLEERWDLLDWLVRARQAMSVDPVLSGRLLQAFRADWGVADLNLDLV
jgi:hypothetical protein